MLAIESMNRISHCSHDLTKTHVFYSVLKHYTHASNLFLSYYFIFKETAAVVCIINDRLLLFHLPQPRGMGIIENDICNPYV